MEHGRETAFLSKRRSAPCTAAACATGSQQVCTAGSTRVFQCIPAAATIHQQHNAEACGASAGVPQSACACLELTCDAR